MVGFLEIDVHKLGVNLDGHGAERHADLLRNDIEVLPDNTSFISIELNKD